MKKLTLLLIICVLLLTGCVRARPDHTNNVCSIFQQYPDWYWAAKDAEKKWGIPVATQMAIMDQESSFDGRAKPPREKLLWIIPWKRQSSAYGYSQALKGTWKDYEQQTHSSASRTSFDDACDFIGWYSSQTHQQLGIQPTNTYALYLAYHEGPYGYAKWSYLKKPWLIKVSRKVANRAALYNQQLEGCADSIPKDSWW